MIRKLRKIRQKSKYQQKFAHNENCKYMIENVNNLKVVDTIDNKDTDKDNLMNTQQYVLTGNTSGISQETSNIN